jgi:hypothetical protein
MYDPPGLAGGLEVDVASPGYWPAVDLTCRLGDQELHLALAERRRGVRGLLSLRGFAMKCSVVLAALTAAVTVAACGGGSSTFTSGSGAPAASGAAQFGGDPCTALTRAEVETATYPQGTAVFDSNDRQKDAGTHLPVVCQWLVTFNGAPSTVGVVVSLMDDSEYAKRAVASIVAPPVALTGIGSEAFLVQSAPGLYEVYVSAKNGKFKLGAQDRATATALAKTAAGRD